MSDHIYIEPLTKEAFAPYGDVIDASGDPTFMINNGLAGRYHDQASVDCHSSGQAGLSVVVGQPYALPHRIELFERHPLGSQAFVPMSETEFLVVVTSKDGEGNPVSPAAFLVGRQQGINIHRGVWHGILTPLTSTTHFLVVDWIGETNNLEEFHLDTPLLVSMKS